jgi:tetratricopeptide (TPR) repeat protein
MRGFRQGVLALAIGLAGGASMAQPIKDPQWAAWMEARRFADVERAAAARIAGKPDDMDAYTALIHSVLALNDAARREAALKQLEACADKLPQAAMCHYGVGSVLGVHAMSQGMMKAAMKAGQIRDAFQKALAIDPQFYAARNGLVQFYLLAPGVVGGSVAKAHEVAQGAAPRQPEHAKVLLAFVALNQKKPSDAERELASVKPGTDKELAGDVDALWVGIGFEYLNDKQTAKARALFERFVKERPDAAIVHYGMGRVLTDASAYDAAIAELELASRLEGGKDLPVDYRLGIALQAKGERDKARAALSRFVGTGKGNPKNLDDAKKRLAELG